VPEVKAINEKIAAMFGTSADQIAINDLVVNPVSKNVYISVSRGRGPDAVPVILRADPAGKISELSLDKIRHASVALPDPVSVTGDTPRAQSTRMDTITQLKYVNGKVLVADSPTRSSPPACARFRIRSSPQTRLRGLRSIHGSHGRFETNAPVRTFVPYEINHEMNILAAYTCTPLVKIPCPN
jgi:hypothetical protein